MVSRPAPALTKIGFRRDIKYFLAVYVGFLIFLILILLSLLQANTTAVEESMHDQWTVIADAASNALSNTPGDIDVRERLSSLRAEYGIASIEFRPIAGRTFRMGNKPRDAFEIGRSVPAGKAIFQFDDSRLLLARRRFRDTALITLSATIVGTLLLIAFLPRVVRPIEQMLDDARELGERASGEDEQAYLIETFRRSIATLKTQEEQLKDLHEKEKTRADELELVTATLTRSLTTGFLAVDRDGAILEINAAGREILDLEEKSYRGIGIKEGLGDTPFAQVVAEASDQQIPLNRHEVSHEGGRMIGVSTVPLVTDAGEHLGMISLFTDLTPVRVLESRVREMQTLAELGEMSAGIAHEFRNALSAILGYLKLARRQELAPDIDTKLKNAEQEAVVLSGAVDGLLSFARPMRLDRQRVDLGEVIDDVVSRLSPIAGTVQVAIQGEPFTIEGDAPMLSRAIENVVRNGIESAREKGDTGRVVIDMQPERASIAIGDNGAGVDMADVPRLFLPFQSGKASGLGLGLPLARKVILLHGGSIVLNGTPGEGATVTIAFDKALDERVITGTFRTTSPGFPNKLD